ncbi:MAG: DUF1730 domain-containing protein [Elusimicrobia bacterium]|nr:DUF1730 domain-containing protein [Elusimicrobiota bacterium]
MGILQPGTLVNSARLKEIALSAGADAAGISPAAVIPEIKRFSAAVKDAPRGLSYLGRGLSRRENVKNWYAEARCVLMCAFRYWGPARDHSSELAKAGEPMSYLKNTGRKLYQPGLLARAGAKLSRYVLNRDYHIAVKEKLAAMLERIRAEEPAADGKLFCDSSPVLEKELARLAGLGFRGKNTLLISPGQGSYFFLGGIALNFEAEADAPCAGSCGSCGACERACPTGALKGGTLDASRCISYWTTQAKEEIPPEIDALNPGWAYGCDLCQEACPYNAKSSNYR